MKSFLKLRMKNKGKPASPLAKAMQETEAEAVSGAILLLKDKPYPLISIHDAIVTTKAGISDVEQSLMQSFITAKLEPRLVVKPLTTVTDSVTNRIEQH